MAPTSKFPHNTLVVTSFVLSHIGGPTDPQVVMHYSPTLYCKDYTTCHFRTIKAPFMRCYKANECMLVSQRDPDDLHPYSRCGDIMHCLGLRFPSDSQTCLPSSFTTWPSPPTNLG
ncbi:hypothetical protein M405DRAFT_21882 [Rhizopogon salebrosus TDB-379]|nr:hypothetical protein M405DRAFT_21882 [Rhizopogon salebrosus TDB-379]